MTLIKIICGFKSSLYVNIVHFNRMSSGNVSEEVLVKCCTPAGMLSKEMIDKKCKYSIYSFVLTFCVGIFIRAQRE